MTSNLDANADWLAHMDVAVDYLSSQCAESDAVELRHDADAVHSLTDDVTSSLQQLIAQSTDTETQRSQVCSWFSAVK